MTSAAALEGRLRDWPEEYGIMTPELARELADKLHTAESRVDGLCAIRRLVEEQAKDEGLWFIAHTVTKSYLQEQLRQLHALIEHETRWWTP